MYRGGNLPHTISLKKLVPINFTYFESTGGLSKSTKDTQSSTDKPTKKEDKEAMCSLCKKRLSNNTLMFLMKPRGHVVCKTCH